MPAVRISPNRCLYLALLAIVVFVALASSAIADGRSPRGSAKGVALLSRVNHVYETVKAVSIRGRSQGLRFGWTLILAEGMGVREEFVAQSSNETIVLVSSGRKTYSLHVKRNCWSLVPVASPQAFENLYLPFPNQPNMILAAPKQTQRGWILPFRSQDVHGSLNIRAGSLEVEQITVSAQSGSIIESVSALAHAPRLNAPKPLC